MTGVAFGGAPPSAIQAVAGFGLLFTVTFDRRVGAADVAAATNASPFVPFSPAELAAYQGLRDESERHVLGSAFVEAGRLTQVPIGRISLALRVGDPHFPDTASVRLFAHVSGTALWEVWLPGRSQDFDAARWISWLDELSDDGLPARVWLALRPLNKALGGGDRYRQYLPCIVVRLAGKPLAELTALHAADIVGLLWRDRSTRTVKPEVVAETLQHDYCAREGGITLLGRRAALDVHGSDDEGASLDLESGLPPRSTVPFLVTLEMLLIERAVLMQLYEQLTRSTPADIDGLLELKRKVTDGLEEYYGATLAATRFGDAVAEDGERLFGIIELYDALMDRLESVSFALTTRYQQRMTQMQFWLTVVFGATEIGFIAASIATWHYRSELGFVLGWTVGSTVVSAGMLVALLRRFMAR